MRIRLAIISGAVLVLTAGTGAAYAVVGHSTVSPTVTGNVLPLDDNHSSTTARQSGDDHGGRSATAASPTTEPGDDRGAATNEPGDDRNRGRGTDDATATPTRTGGTIGTVTGSSGSSGGHGSDDSAAATTAAGATHASGTGVDDSGRGRDGAGHH